MADRYASLKQGLVGAWIPSISGSGLLLPDLSGRGNNGTLTNMAADDWVASEGGRALDFDGVNDQVVAKTSVVLRKNTGLTICAWIYRAATNQNAAFFKSGAAGSGNGYGLGVGANNNADSAGNTVNLLMEGLTWVGTGVTISAQQWHHLAIVIRPTSTGSTADAVINGIPAGLSYTSGLDASTNDILMGGYNAAGLLRFFTGAMDDVLAYNRALSTSEIRLLATRRGIAYEQRKPKLLFHQFPSGSSRRLLLTGQT